MNWQEELTAEWRRESAKRWDRRTRAPRWPLLLFLVVAIGIAIAASRATPETPFPLLAAGPAPRFAAVVLVAPPPPPPPRPAREEDAVETTPSELDGLWSQVRSAREQGDVPALLTQLRAIIQRHPADARTPEAALLIVDLTPAQQERCQALSLAVNSAPSSSMAQFARARLNRDHCLL